MVERIKPERGDQPYLREHRKAVRMTQEQIAEQLKTTKATISRYETFQRDHPGGFLQAFAQVVGKPVVDLYHPPSEPSLDAMVRDASPEMRAKIRAIIETLLKTETR